MNASQLRDAIESTSPISPETSLLSSSALESGGNIDNKGTVQSTAISVNDSLRGLTREDLSESMVSTVSSSNIATTAQTKAAGERLRGRGEKFSKVDAPSEKARSQSLGKPRKAETKRAQRCRKSSRTGPLRNGNRIRTIFCAHLRNQRVV